MFKRIVVLFLLSMIISVNGYGADINDWIRGGGVDCVEGTENISDIDDMITNYLQDPLDRLLTGYVRGCTITVTDDEVLTISAGKVMTTTAGGVHRMRKNTSTTTVDNTAADVGGLDTGAVAASTWYYVYAVADADATTFTAILSASASAPTNASALHYALIGCALTDATSDWLTYYWSGDGVDVTIMWDVPINETTTQSASVWSAALDCSSSMPSISTMGIFGLGGQGTNNVAKMWIRPNGSTWDTGNENACAGGVTASHASGMGGQRICMTDSSQQIQYQTYALQTSCALDVEGFIFNR